MPVPRTAEEAFASYVLLRAVSPRGWVTPTAGRPPPDQGTVHRALALLVDQPAQAGLNPVEDEVVLGELRGITGRDAGPAELLTLSAAAAAALYRATSEQAGQP